MQHDAAHVRIVVIEHVSHLAVGQRRIGKAEPQFAAEDGGLRFAGNLLQHRQQRGDGFVPAAGERAADPIEHAAARLVLRRSAEIAELRRRQIAAQRLGQRFRFGGEVLIHIYCGSMPASWMALVQRATSALIRLVASSGVPPIGS